GYKAQRFTLHEKLHGEQPLSVDSQSCCDACAVMDSLRIFRMQFFYELHSAGSFSARMKITLLISMAVLLAACSCSPEKPAVPVAQQKQDTVKPPPAPDTATFVASGRVMVMPRFCGGAYSSAAPQYYGRKGVKIFIKGDSINTD